MIRTLTTLGALCLSSVAFGQGGPQNPVNGQALVLETTNASVIITTGTVYQQLLPSVAGAKKQRQSLTIENNNVNGDNCWVFIGSGTPTMGNSILLTQGGAYQRYWPYTPSDVIQVTCATDSDTLYVDYQTLP